MANSTAYSLRRRLLVRLWLPLFVVMLFGALVAFGLARHFGNAVHDRWLYDSAMTLATQLKYVGGNVALDLPTPAVEMFEWDSVDQIYEQVTSSKKGRVFGNIVFSPPSGKLTQGQPFYYDDVVADNLVRVVAVLLPSKTDSSDTITIQVAETKNKRQALVTEIILISVPVQIAILAMAGGIIWLAVTSSLRSMDDIASRLAGYKADSQLPMEDLEGAPSEMQPLIKSLNLVITRLAESQDIQQRFVANAAHQLRTPLATMQLQTERALREQDPTKHGEALANVLAAVTRLRHVTRQLLTLNRSERSVAGMLEMQSLDLAILVREEVENWADHAIAKGIDIGYDGAERDVRIRGEAYLLRDLIGNLIDNAIQYGYEGGEVTLDLRLNPTTLFVDDDGPGIPEHERSLVLERFYRRPDSGGSGSGLGLAIALEIAARHGAQLKILNRPDGQGTRVEIVFAS